MPFKKGERISPGTEFKLGVPPNNKLPVGTITTRQHNGDSPRAWIKIAEPNIWMPNADFMWLRRGGTIPHGFVIHHLDHNTLNDDISNLCLITRGEHINHHRPELEQAKEGLILPVKEVVCSVCHKTYQGKAQRKHGQCPDCRIKVTRKRQHDYKARLRSGFGRGGSGNSPKDR